MNKNVKSEEIGGLLSNVTRREKGINFKESTENRESAAIFGRGSVIALNDREVIR